MSCQPIEINSNFVQCQMFFAVNISRIDFMKIVFDSKPMFLMI